MKITIEIQGHEPIIPYQLICIKTKEEAEKEVLFLLIVVLILSWCAVLF